MIFNSLVQMKINMGVDFEVFNTIRKIACHEDAKLCFLQEEVEKSVDRFCT